ncbi:MULTISPECIES: MetQ/NlpA family ABC transporter substrate-binding protein [Streptomyces]|uniref:Lipoprotein n=1 Tax=Streptomyces albus (strain ATCC 21838 / DSM 41398 / FERM P-419 / JCM 4703 / NBRC 107858) TaxID=1081613 RepID=A0A0B5EV98_STRA4|nr:MetQ/NlpA family ABC transporter substrate-binding protein [Streptomyces sp. SCSIO ZS0520]AJE86748.1 ABC transporter substrate-binding protein [Streptomyces albus]AOU81052.1 ABC transporter substrate-binding protein [Streptomyces albus]AYN36754.1 metal ABC transporter substrate-binding protein [Streptomyces albus]
MRNTLRITTAALATGALALGLTACGGDSESDPDAPLKVAASPVPHAEILDFVKDKLADKAGLKLDVREFTDYVTPNTATENGDVDANYFQNQPYLDDFNKKNNTHIAPVVTVHLEPLGLYSEKAKKAEQLPKGATIALPNDTVNEARALKLLDANGVITLKDGVGNEATPKDIAKNPRGVKFKELEAAQVARSLKDVDAAVINGNYAIEAGLKPAEDALVLETTENNPYGNFLAVKKGNEDDPRVKKLAKLLTSPEVKKFIKDKYAGSVLSVG